MMTAEAATTTYTRVLPGVPESVSAARSFVRKVLAGFPRVDDAELCASEAATNSVVHSRASLDGHTFMVTIVVAEDRWVRVEVSDPGPLPAPPPPSPPCGLGESGRGWSVVVQELADSSDRGDCLAWFRLNWSKGD